MHKGKSFWQRPFAYSHNIIIMITIMVLGILLELVTKGKGIIMPPFPYNIIIGIFFVTLLSGIYIFKIFAPIVRWLLSIPLVLCSLSAFTLLLLFAGIIPQPIKEPLHMIKYLGGTHITRSWPYALLLILILSSLYLSSLKRITHYKKSDWGFILNHLGLFIILAGASFGSGDVITVKMELRKDKLVWQSYDNYSNRFAMPFAMRLMKFDLEHYHPELVIAVKNKSMEVKKKLVNLPAKSTIFKKWNIKIFKYYKEAYLMGKKYVPLHHFGTCPAVYIEAENKQTKEIRRGWVSSGSVSIPPHFLELEKSYYLAMPPRKAKQYSSYIRIFHKRLKKIHEIHLRVNHPQKIEDWHVYQADYNKKLGKWSDISIVELVKDPWLPIVYFGFFMMLGGALSLLWKR